MQGRRDQRVLRDPRCAPLQVQSRPARDRPRVVDPVVARPQLDPVDDYRDVHAAQGASDAEGAEEGERMGVDEVKRVAMLSKKAMHAEAESHRLA